MEKFIQELGSLEEDLVTMGELALDMLTDSVRAFQDRNVDLALEVDSLKHELDEWDRDIEERCLILLTLHQPMAKDMRNIACILKTITYLNRVGRYGKDIAKDARAMADRPHLAKLVLIPQMHELVCRMVRDCLRAYKADDVECIQDISERDDEVDALWDAVFRESLTYSMEDPHNLGPVIHYIMVSRHLERCGDHACKIAEKVHYKVTGEHIELK